jgi:hypothetical protein
MPQEIASASDVGSGVDRRTENPDPPSWNGDLMTTPKRFRTVLHGTCLVNGRHPAGSQMERECPVLRRRPQGAVDRHGVGEPGPAEASVHEDEAEDEVSSSDPVRTAAARRQRWRAKQIVQAGGVEAWREQERARVRAWRENRTTPIPVA